jgi:hypothetical protein
VERNINIAAVKIKGMQKIMGCEVIEMSFLKGLNIAVKQGNKLLVWPGFQPREEFKYIEVPTPDEWEKQFRVDREKELNEQQLASWESKRIEYLLNRSLFIF